MHLPNDLLNSLEGIKGFDKEAFVKVHESGEQVTSIRINPFKSSMVNGEWSIVNQISNFPIPNSKIPWCNTGYYLDTRPSFTFDPLFHAGCYYVQEASSMFLEQALKQTVDLSKPLKILDLCAAPGGKSTHLLSLISKDSLLVSNEVIRSRANVLNDNIGKWGSSNVIVTNNDPKDFQRLESYFDVIVIDAPCSGSGLFRREPEAIEEWSEQNVELCSQRQQRILADVLPALKSGGLLIYSTCSYSIKEDEQLANWLVTELKVKSEKLKVKSDWGIIESEIGYRFWPDKVKGEGFFISGFKKNNEENDEFYLPKVKPDKFSSWQLEVLKKYIKGEGVGYIKYGKIIHAITEPLLTDLNLLSSKLRLVNCGVKVGEIIKDKLVPEHGLALSNITSNSIQQIELPFEKAIQYLKKKELDIQTDKKGWTLVTYQQHPLGWINILPTRINNYYPKELRILKN